MSRAGHAVYVYCVIRARKSPDVSTSPRGLPGTSRVRALRADESLWLIVADAPLSRYGDEPIARGLKDLDWVAAAATAHERVVEHFAKAEAVVPLKLFTLFASDERALAHVASEGRRIERLLDRVKGRQEWGVRVMLDETRARHRGSERRTRAGRGPSRRATSGATFLLEKKAERDATRALVADARRAADEAFATLARDADQAKRRTPSAVETEARLLLDAAFLVPSRRAARFRTVAERLAARLEDRGGRLRLTGPWPPYNFVGSEG
jgi:Gas vesicle synthesis protein GvpL/GvpF